MTLVTASTHVTCPVAHEVTPVWQALAGTQPRFAVQALQAPALHTMLVPQAVPLLTAVVASLHVATPPVQALTVPLWQALAGVHGAPTVHALHVPE
jgi:hypothetical protein